jgi:hypothetical protein
VAEKSKIDELRARLHVRRTYGPHSLRCAIRREMSAVGVMQCVIDRAMGAYDGAVSKALAEQYSTDGDPVLVGLDKLAAFLGLQIRGDRETRSYVSPSVATSTATAPAINILAAAERHIVAVAENRASALDAVRRRIEITVANLPPRPAPVVDHAPPTVPEIASPPTVTEITVSPSAFGVDLDGLRGLFDTPAISDFVAASAHVTGVQPHQIVGDQQASEIVLARHLAVAAAASETGRSLPAIGRIFHRDHTTILHAVRKIRTAVRQDPETARLYRDVVEEAWRRHRGEGGGERQGVEMEAA